MTPEEQEAFFREGFGRSAFYEALANSIGPTAILAALMWVAREMRRRELPKEMFMRHAASVWELVARFEQEGLQPERIHVMVTESSLSEEDDDAKPN